MAHPTLDPDQLKTLIAISETGSFTKAATEVNKTQAAVSMQIRRLEETTGRRLFTKNGRQNKLTSDGEHLLEYARRIVALNNEAMAIMTTPEIAGYVRIGTPDDYAERFLPQIFARFARTHPLVEVEINCESSLMLLQRVIESEIDMAIVTHCDTARHGQVIRRERLFWVTSPRHKVHEQDPLPLAMGPITCCWRQSAIQALDTERRPYRMLYSSASATALSAAVLSGLAISVMPESAIRPGMHKLSEEDGLPELPSCDIALLRAPASQSSSVEALAQHIIESLSNLDVERAVFG